MNTLVYQILKRFSGTFHRAQTLKLGGVTSSRKSLYFLVISNYVPISCFFEVLRDAGLNSGFLARNFLSEDDYFMIFGNNNALLI